TIWRSTWPATTIWPACCPCARCRPPFWSTPAPRCATASPTPPHPGSSRRRSPRCSTRTPRARAQRPDLAPPAHRPPRVCTAADGVYRSFREQPPRVDARPQRRDADVHAPLRGLLSFLPLDHL